MTPRRKGIGVTIAAIVVIIVVIVGAIGYLSFTRQAYTFQPFQPNDFSKRAGSSSHGHTPEQYLHPVLQRDDSEQPVTALSFSLNQSWVEIYTNGTEWVPYSQACSSILESSSSDESVPSQASYSVSFYTVSGPCYNPPAPGWIPVNGTAIDAYERLTELNSSQVRLSVAPTAAPANQTVSLQFTITLNLKPGIYVIAVALGVQTTNAYGGFFEYADLYPFPVIAKS